MSSAKKKIDTTLLHYMYTITMMVMYSYMIIAQHIIFDKISLCTLHVISIYTGKHIN